MKYLSVQEPPPPENRGIPTPQLYSQRRARQSIWSYRCFVFRRHRSGWRALNILKLLTMDIPRGFLWMKLHDREGLKAYVDAVISNRGAHATLFEERGYVEQVEYDPPMIGDTFRLSAKALFGCLALRDAFDVPLFEKVTFVTDGQKLVPTEFIALLSECADNPEWFGNPDKWRWATPEDLDRISGGDPMKINSGMYRGKPNFMNSSVPLLPGVDADTGGEMPDTPPSETEIRRDAYEKHFELLTCVRSSRARTYFVRRLATYRGQVMLSASSFNPLGPWTVYARDSALLLANGVNE